MTRGPVFQLEGVVKRLGEIFTLSIKRLDVSKGEVLCILGPTGAGKSTLLHLLAGLAPLSEGRIQFDGRCVDARTMPVSLRRRIAMVHQRPHLLTGPVRRSVEYGMRVRRWNRRSERMLPLLERLGLNGLASQSAQELSGGQIQLVALARAMVVQPEVLVLDEPTAHLDPARVALVEDVVAETRKEREMTVIWATHNLFQARRVADRIGLLWNGRLIEVAPTRAFFESPADPRTADFTAGRLVY